MIEHARPVLIPSLLVQLEEAEEEIMRDHTLVAARQGPILESSSKGGPERRRLHCRNIDSCDRRCERFDRDYALRMGVLADLQSDKDERCQHRTSADDLGQSRELPECHRPDNSHAPHILHSRNSRAYASVSERLTKNCNQPLIRAGWPKRLSRRRFAVDLLHYFPASCLSGGLK